MSDEGVEVDCHLLFDQTVESNRPGAYLQFLSGVGDPLMAAELIEIVVSDCVLFFGQLAARNRVPLVPLDRVQVSCRVASCSGPCSRSTPSSAA